MNNLVNVHIIDNYLINPTNPIIVNLIGAGGTGSQMLTALARMNHSLLALNHPGLKVFVYDKRSQPRQAIICRSGNRDV
jgi:flavin-dependent dehydrogenase